MDELQELSQLISNIPLKENGKRECSPHANSDVIYHDQTTQISAARLDNSDLSLIQRTLSTLDTSIKKIEKQQKDMFNHIYRHDGVANNLMCEDFISAPGIKELSKVVEFSMSQFRSPWSTIKDSQQIQKYSDIINILRENTFTNGSEQAKQYQ